MSFTIRQLRDYLTSHMDFDRTVVPEISVSDDDDEIAIQDLYDEVEAYYEEEA